MKIKKAIGRWLLLSPMSLDKETESGLLIKSSNMRFKKAKVIKSSFDEVKEGDIVIYDSSNTHETIIDKTKYVITKIDNIAIII